MPRPSRMPLRTVGPGFEVEPLVTRDGPSNTRVRLLQLPGEVDVEAGYTEDSTVGMMTRTPRQGGAHVGMVLFSVLRFGDNQGLVASANFELTSDYVPLRGEAWRQVVLGENALRGVLAYTLADVHTYGDTSPANQLAAHNQYVERLLEEFGGEPQVLEGHHFPPIEDVFVQGSSSPRRR